MSLIGSLNFARAASGLSYNGLAQTPQMGWVSDKASSFESRSIPIKQVIYIRFGSPLGELSLTYSVNFPGYI